MLNKDIKGTEITLKHSETGKYLNILDKIPYNDALSYIQSFNKLKLPDNSCIFKLNLHLYYQKEYFTDMNRWTSTNTRKEQDLSHMEIDYRLNGNLRKCNSDDCLKNLASGKCKDAFVIEHIGKKFFANKYQEHTK